MTSPVTSPQAVFSPNPEKTVRACPWNPKTPPDLHKRQTGLLSFQIGERHPKTVTFPQVRGCPHLSSLRERGVPRTPSPLTRSGEPS